MGWTIEKLSPEIWEQMAENAHLVVFKERRDKIMDRIDFALLAADEETHTPAGYITCRECDAKTLYWSHGGAFPSVRGTNQSFPVYKEFIKWCAERYDMVLTQIENINRPYLKFALQVGFVIWGLRHVRGQVFLELALDFRPPQKSGRSEKGD